MRRCAARQKQRRHASLTRALRCAARGVSSHILRILRLLARSGGDRQNGGVVAPPSTTVARSPAAGALLACPSRLLA